MQFNGTTSIVQKTDADIVGSSPFFSFAAWIAPIDIGETQGRIFVLDETGGSLAVLLVSGALRFSRDWNGTAVNWDISIGTAYAFGRTTGIFITYDGTSTSNTPQIYTQMIGQDGGLVRRTVTLISSAPTGTIETPTTGYAVGNRAATDRTFNGQISYVQAFDRVLTPYEGQRALKAPGSVKTGLRLNLHLDRDTFDRSGRGQHGVGTAVVPGSMPTGVKPYSRPRRIVMPLSTTPPGGGFQPAWAAHANSIYGVGVL